MRQITYTSKGSSARNSYRYGSELIVLPGASFPDICVGCGNPAWGNVANTEFHDFGGYWILLPSGLDLIALGLRKRYLFDFPFCSNCPPSSFRLKKVRVDDYLSVFLNAPKAFLDSLPLMPSPVQKERNRSSGFNEYSGDYMNEIPLPIPTTSIGRMVQTNEGFSQVVWPFPATVILFPFILNIVEVQDFVGAGFRIYGICPDVRTGSDGSRVHAGASFSGHDGVRRSGAQGICTLLLLTTDLVFPILYGSFLTCRFAAHRVVLRSRHNELGGSGGWDLSQPQTGRRFVLFENLIPVVSRPVHCRVEAGFLVHSNEVLVFLESVWRILAALEICYPLSTADAHGARRCLTAKMGPGRVLPCHGVRGWRNQLTRRKTSKTHLRLNHVYDARSKMIENYQPHVSPRDTRFPFLISLKVWLFLPESSGAGRVYEK